MDIEGIERRRRKWCKLKKRLGRTAIMGCCGGGPWQPKSSTIIDILAQPQDDDDDEEEQAIASNMITVEDAGRSSGMNLAMALAAERNLRSAAEEGATKTLRRLIGETERGGEVVVGGRCDWMCCVCMERKKGAAFIPCGHAFCRVCSGEVWLTRSSCPLCNRSILDILQIF